MVEHIAISQFLLKKRYLKFHILLVKKHPRLVFFPAKQSKIPIRNSFKELGRNRQMAKTARFACLMKLNRALVEFVGDGKQR